MRKIAKAACVFISACLASCGGWAVCAQEQPDTLVAEFEHQSIYITAEEVPDCSAGTYSAYRVQEDGTVDFGCWTLTPQRTAVEVWWTGNPSLTLSYDQLKKVE